MLMEAADVDEGSWSAFCVEAGPILASRSFNFHRGSAELEAETDIGCYNCCASTGTGPVRTLP